MRTVELFCGTKSFSKVAQRLGHSIFTVDNDPQFAPLDVLGDIRELTTPPYEKIDVLWASPPCQGFSVAAIGKNWVSSGVPKTDSARLGMELVEKTISLIEAWKPKWWFIENPRAMLRKLPMMQNFRRVTVTYCKYGDSRMKPTDIWTNVPPEIWTPRPACQNGDSCHVAAPRGSRTGTQGIKGAVDRGAIPGALFEEILSKL